MFRIRVRASGSRRVALADLQSFQLRLDDAAHKLDRSPTDLIWPGVQVEGDPFGWSVVLYLSERSADAARQIALSEIEHAAANCHSLQDWVLEAIECHEAAPLAQGFARTSGGVSWSEGGEGGGPAGVREPRGPRPFMDSSSSAELL